MHEISCSYHLQTCLFWLLLPELKFCQLLLFIIVMWLLVYQQLSWQMIMSLPSPQPLFGEVPLLSYPYKHFPPPILFSYRSSFWHKQFVQYSALCHPPFLWPLQQKFPLLLKHAVLAVSIFCVATFGGARARRKANDYRRCILPLPQSHTLVFLQKSHNLDMIEKLYWQKPTVSSSH